MDKVTQTRMIVAANVKRFREAKRMTVIEAAEELGVGRQYWYLIESGGGNLPLDRLEQVADVLDVTPSDLLTEDSLSTFAQSGLSKHSPKRKSKKRELVRR